MRSIYSMFSFVFVFLYVLLLLVVLSGVSLGSFGPVLVNLMWIIPLMGMIAAIMGKHGLVKAIGLIFNGTALFIILFALALGGMGED